MKKVGTGHPLADTGLPEELGAGMKGHSIVGLLLVVGRRESGGPEGDAYTLQPGAAIRLVSWNLDRLKADQPPRMLAAMAHIRQLFHQDSESDPLIIMFQEVSTSSRVSDKIRRFAGSSGHVEILPNPFIIQ